MIKIFSNRVLLSFGLYLLLDGTVFRIKISFHFMVFVFVLFCFFPNFACNWHWRSKTKPVLSEATEVN